MSKVVETRPVILPEVNTLGPDPGCQMNGQLECTSSRPTTSKLNDVSRVRFPWNARVHSKTEFREDDGEGLAV